MRVEKALERSQRKEKTSERKKRWAKGMCMSEDLKGVKEKKRN